MSPSLPYSLVTSFLGCRDCAYEISVMIFFLNDFVIFFNVSLSIGYAVLTMKEKREPILSVPRFFICSSIKVCIAFSTSGLDFNTLDILMR